MAKIAAVSSAGGQDYFTIIVASLILLLVLIVSYMCLQLFKQRTPGQQSKQSNFLSTMMYRPACGNQWLNIRRNECRGISKGHPPSIETEHSFYSSHEGGVCSGSFEVPP